MKITSLYPLLTAPDLEAAKSFYTTYFPFEVVFESDWYVSLRSTGDRPFELALIVPNHETVPEGFHSPSTTGVILTIEVEDVDAAYATMESAGFPMQVPLRSEPHGQRHFIMEDPNGVLVDVITPIPPSDEFMEGYV